MTSTMFDTIPVHQLHPHDDNVRSGLGDLDELTASVREHGVLEPLIVAPDPDEFGRYIIIAGHRRHAAAAAAGLGAVDCVIRADLTTTRDVIEAMLVENLHRAELSPVDEAEAYQRLVLFDMTPASIATRVGRSETTVRRRLALVELPEATRDRVHTGQLTLAQAEAAAEFVDDPTALAELAETAPSEFDHRVRMLRSFRESRRTMDTRAEEVRAAGGAVTETDRAFVAPDGAAQIQPWTVGFTIEDHLAQHPGCHLLQINRSRASCCHFCTDPAAHGYAPPAMKATERDSAAAEAEETVRAAAEERRRELETADEARLDWLVSVMRRVPSPRREVTTAMLRQAVRHVIEWEGLLHDQRWLSLAGWGDFDTDDETTCENLLTELNTYGVPRLVQLLWAGTVVLSLRGLAQGGHIDNLDALMEIGYEPVEIERTLLAERDTRAGGGDG